MFNKHLLLAVAISMLMFGTFARADDGQPYYLIATISVPDFDSYMTDYGSLAMSSIQEAGGEILVGSQEFQLLEGDYLANLTVVVKFPSEAAARLWYESPEYQALIPVRHALTNQDTTVLLLAPQFAPPN